MLDIFSLLIVAISCAAAGTGSYAAEPSALAPTTTDPPLFAAFKTFCVDTRANPEAMKAALEAAGGSPHTQGSTDWPFAMSTQSWGIKLNGRDMTVATGTEHIRPDQTANSSPINSTDCIINEFAKDDAGIAAIQKWVGVPPSRSSGKAGPYTLKTGQRLPAIKIYFYSYQIVGNARMAVTDFEAERSAEREGRAWGLVLIEDAHSASLQFLHELPQPQKENSPGQ